MIPKNILNANIASAQAEETLATLLLQQARASGKEDEIRAAEIALAKATLNTATWQRRSAEQFPQH
jgi:hypothetical protein